MRTFKLFLSVLVIFITVVSCSRNEDEVVPDKMESSEFPERPDLEGGESNWVPKSDKQTKIVEALTTTDLTVITANDLVSALIGDGPDAPTISNVTFNGASIAAGTFSGGTGILGFEDGIVLSSGNVASVVGPNNADGTTTILGTGGDADLQTLIPGFSILDATTLEFEFTCETTQFVSFQYVFTSEEYNEFVNSEFNDVFGFFLNGVNIALIPDSVTPVSINNVNCGNPYDSSGGTNCDLFINNDLSDGGGSINIEMDGLTVVLTASSAIPPGTNTIKLAIADAGDRSLDSNVFIKGESFICALPSIDVNLDIHPTSCPNPLSPNSKGVLPVSINGSEDFDVNEIDLSTVTLEGVSPVNSSIEDVSTPFETNLEEPLDPYSCTTAGPDGYNDLTLKFDYEELRSVLGELNREDVITLSISGQLLDGTEFLGTDIVVVK